MSEETPKDSLSMLKMAQEVHDKMVSEAQEKKDQMIWEAEKIIRAAEESAASRLAEVEDEAAKILSDANEKAAELENNAIEQASIIESNARKEYDHLRTELEKLQAFESEYRDRLHYLVSTAAKTLEVTVDEEVSVITDAPESDFVATEFSYDYDSDEVSTATSSITLDGIHSSGEEVIEEEVSTDVYVDSNFEIEEVTENSSEEVETEEHDATEEVAETELTDEELDQAKTIGDILNKD